jgi:hypothetical protein
MSASVAEAARAVEDGDLGGDPDGEPRDHAGAEGGASADPDLTEVDEQEPTDPFSRLMQPLEGSIREDRVGEMWNPEQGGLNRLVLVAEETFGLGDGLPRVAHVPIALAEIAQEPPSWIRDRTEENSESGPVEEGAPVEKGDTKDVMQA